MLLQTWRWFGPDDRISLQDIKQTGATGIVNALHHIPVGDVWTKDEISARKEMIEAAGFSWAVVESVPVHEDIKKHSGDYLRYIENYKITLRNLAEFGIPTICYNFMPILDWSRTNLAYKFADKSEVTRFDYACFIAFDIHILKREGARKSYPPEAIIKADEYFNSLSGEEAKALENTILLGLPGSGESITLEQLKSRLKEYEHINENQLREHLIYFIREIAPVAENVGINLAIHPDDPPWSLLGLPRIVGNDEDLMKIIAAYPSPVNGITLCTGSLGAGYFNNVAELTRKYAYRINFAHLRNVACDTDLNFNEEYLFNGNVDMVGVMQALVAEEGKRIKSGRSDWVIPIRPDHGNQMLDDLGKDNYPGYSLYGRMKSLAEIRGLEIGIRNSL